MTSLQVSAVAGLPELTVSDDLADLICREVDLQDGDVLVVTSKAISKAEGRVRTGDRAEAIADETESVVARRGETVIARTRHGLVMAAAGVDASNVEVGSVVLLPADPDASARALRARVHERGGANVAVVVTDTSGRAWRNGQTDIAIGIAGMDPLDDHAGRTDGYGNPLMVTAPALADEIAAVGDLVKGKLTGSPVALVRGLSHLVLPVSVEGPGAVALIRDPSQDMFGLGAREAVVRALSGARPDPGFGAAASTEDLTEALVAAGAQASPSGPGRLTVVLPDGAYERGAATVRLTAIAHAHGWATEQTPAGALTFLVQP